MPAKERRKCMEAIIAYLACVCVLLIFGRLFILPIKMIAKLVINSILGIILLYIINLVGVNFSFHIGINWITVVVVGLLGAPRSNTFINFKVFNDIKSKKANNYIIYQVVQKKLKKISIWPRFFI